MNPQYDGLETSLYVFSEKGQGTRYSLKDKSWHRFSRYPGSVMSLGGGAPVGTATVFIAAGSPLGGENSFSIYNTITDRWADSSPPPFGTPPLTLISNGESLFAPVLDGDRLTVFRGRQKRSEQALSVLDYIVLCGYFVLLIVMGFFFSKRYSPPACRVSIAA